MIKPLDSIDSARLVWDEEPIAYRIIYGDTDKAGVVYYANYLRFFEAGRTEWLRRKLGVSYASLEGQNILFPVVEAAIKYKAPAKYDDLVHIYTALAGFSKVTISFYYEIKRDGKILVTGHTKHASTDMNGNLTKMPANLIDAFGQLTDQGHF